MEEGGRRAAAFLPEELIIEILARLPAKSLCRCKCVSPAWRALISDPANRSRFAHTLSGLFFPDSRPDFIGLSMSTVSAPPAGVDTALSFLPPTCGDMELLDSCNGLLLLCCAGVRESPSPLPRPLTPPGVQESPSPPQFYVVCNPATGEWVTLPQPSHVPGLVCYTPSDCPTRDTCTAAIGFDPSSSPHFHVFQVVQMLDGKGSKFSAEGVEIYSSQTGRWVLSNNKCNDRDYIKYIGHVTYFKGFLLICIGDGVLSVDTEGQTWRISRVRQNGGWDHGCSIGHSQGHLVYVDTNVASSDILIYELKDKNISKPDLFGPLKLGMKCWYYYTAVVHPDCNLIFFYDWSKEELISYDMKQPDVHVTCTLEVPYFEDGTDNVHCNFFPYVPLYSRALPSSSLN